MPSGPFGWSSATLSDPRQRGNQHIPEYRLTGHGGGRNVQRRSVDRTLVIDDEPPVREPDQLDMPVNSRLELL